MSIPGELRQEGPFAVKNLLLTFWEKYPHQVKKKKKGLHLLQHLGMVEDREYFIQSQMLSSGSHRNHEQR